MGRQERGAAGFFSVYDEDGLKRTDVVEAKKLIGEGFKQRESAELIRLLGHAEYKVRQRAQFALAARGEKSVEELTKVAVGKGDRFGRIHAIWALGQIGRKTSAALTGVEPLLADADEQIRIQAAKVLGEAGVESARAALEKMLGRPVDARPLSTPRPPCLGWAASNRCPRLLKCWKRIRTSTPICVTPGRSP